MQDGRDCREEPEPEAFDGDFECEPMMGDDGKSVGVCIFDASGAVVECASNICENDDGTHRLYNAGCWKEGDVWVLRRASTAGAVSAVCNVTAASTSVCEAQIGSANGHTLVGGVCS